jgi:poly-gamma-glutamate synthesis protein (capsule biosynthesis protein)
MTARLPWTAKDIFKLSPKEWLIYNGTIAFHMATGLWRYPVPTSGDMETMTRRDLIYWVYKARFPLTRAVRNSGLEAFFEEQSRFRWALPAGFAPSAEIELSAVGDLMNHQFLPNSADCLYQATAETIFGVDVSMANLECVVYPQGTAAFEITTSEAPPIYYGQKHFEAAKGPAGRGYAFMATANNHSLDCGEDGVVSTIRALKEAGIAQHGMNETESDSRSATILEKKGVRLGLISHTFGLNAKKPPKDKPWIVNRAHLNGKLGEVDFSRIEAQIRFAREKKVDAIIAQLHWGLEHEYYPRPEQLEVARHLAELGVDILIGHHPHLIQPMECYRTRRDPDRVVPIFYSLGNLTTPFSHPAFRRSAVARVRLAKGTARDGSTRAYVKSAGMLEVYQEIDEGNQKLRLVPGGAHVA